MRRIPVAAMVVGLAAVGGTGCADSESVIFIRQVNLPSSTGGTSGRCIVEPNPEGPFISHGALDVAFRREYTASLVVGSQIVATGKSIQVRTETSRVRIEGVEVRVEDALGAVAWGPHTIPATGFIDPALGTEPQYGIVDATLVGADFGARVALVMANDPSRTARHFTSISRVFGHTLGQLAIQSGEFHFPLTICYGCLILFPTDANDPKVQPNPNCEMPGATGSTATSGCSPGQDETIDCRACKAQFPNDPICDPPP